jgi:hypothetical protein
MMAILRIGVVMSVAVAQRPNGWGRTRILAAPMYSQEGVSGATNAPPF